MLSEKIRQAVYFVTDLEQVFAPALLHIKVLLSWDFSKTKLEIFTFQRLCFVANVDNELGFLLFLHHFNKNHVLATVFSQKFYTKITIFG